MKINTHLRGRDFWYCNLAGWTIYILIDAGSVYLHNNDFLGQLTHSIFTAACGIVLGLFYRKAIAQYNFRVKHPLVLVPLSVFLAILFGNLVTSLDYALIRGYGIYSSFFDVWSKPEDYFWFPFIISQWIGTSHIFLIWLLLFNLIQAERYSDQEPRKASVMAKLVAVISVYAFIELFHLLVTLAYYQPADYSFSLAFVVDNLYTLITGVVFAFLVVLVKPRARIFKSHLVATLPSLVFLIFCTSFFCMITFGLLPYRDELWQGSLLELPRNIAYTLTSKGQLWIDKHQFIGTLHSRLQTQTLVVLIFLYFVHSKHPLEKTDDNNKLEWIFWLYNTAGWSVLCGYLYFSDWLNWESISRDFARSVLLSLTIGGLFAGLLMRNIIRHQQMLDNRMSLFIGKSMLIALGMGLLLTGGLWLTGYVLAFASEHLVKDYEKLVNSNEFFFARIGSHQPWLLYVDINLRKISFATQ